MDMANFLTGCCILSFVVIIVLLIRSSIVDCTWTKDEARSKIEAAYKAGHAHGVNSANKYVKGSRISGDDAYLNIISSSYIIKVDDDWQLSETKQVADGKL